MSKDAKKKKAGDADRHPSSNKSGGWLYENEEELKAQRGVMWDMVKQLGQNIVQSKDLTSISMPVRVFEPRSYLQRAPDGWITAPVYLKRAAESSDAVERMKLVITFLVSGLINTCKVMAKPFNPILGETYQAQYADGTMVYCEQSCHHPPVSMYHVTASDNSWHYYGYGAWTASFRGNAIKGLQKGPNFVEFPAYESQISFNLPEAWVRGMLYGQRLIEYDGRVDFVDEKNGLRCELQFNPTGQSLMSSFWGKKLPSDHVRGEIVNADKTVLSTVSGSWLGALEFDNQVYWEFSENTDLKEPTPSEPCLPSDSRFREDSSNLAKREMELAGEWKTKLEEKQRRERKLREQGAVELKASAPSVKSKMVTREAVLARQKTGITL